MRPLTQQTTMTDLRWFTEDAEIAAMDLVKVCRTYSIPSLSAVGTNNTQSFSSSSEQEDEAPLVLASKVTERGGGVVSPNSTCRQRRLSHAIVTNEFAKHPFLSWGRPRMLSPVQATSREKESELSYRKEKSPVRGAKAEAGIGSKRPLCSPTPFQRDLFTTMPAPLRRDAWEEVPASNYSVRGRKYLQDGRKMPSQDSIFRLLTVDLVKVDQPLRKTGLSQQPGERIQQALARERRDGANTAAPEFIFCVNLSIPGRSQYHWVAYFGVDDVSVLQDPTTAFGRLAQPFFFGDSDAYRDEHFKLIPQIVQGNFLVRKAVGSKPSLLGQKLKCHYIRTERSLEIVVDIGSESLAQSILKLALGYAKTLQVDMMFLLEGKSEATLPECVLGGVRIKHLDFAKRDGQRTLAPVPTLQEKEEYDNDLVFREDGTERRQSVSTCESV